MSSWFAIVQVYADGSVFPVRLDVTSKEEGARSVAWMQKGQGQFEDWRCLPMSEMRKLLEAGKVRLGVFTPDAQERMRAEIMVRD